MSEQVNVNSLVSSMEKGDVCDLSGDEIIALGHSFGDRAHKIIIEYTS